MVVTSAQTRAPLPPLHGVPGLGLRVAFFIDPDLPIFIAVLFITAGPDYAVANMRIYVDCWYFFSNVSVLMFLVDLLEYTLLASYLDQGPKIVPQNALGP